MSGAQLMGGSLHQACHGNEIGTSLKNAGSTTLARVEATNVWLVRNSPGFNSIPASPVTVESEGRMTKQCLIKYRRYYRVPRVSFLDKLIKSLDTYGTELVYVWRTNFPWHVPLEPCFPCVSVAINWCFYSRFNRVWKHFMHKFCTQTELSFFAEWPGLWLRIHLLVSFTVPSARYEKMNVLWILQHS